MARSSYFNPSARDALDRYKLEAAFETHINLKKLKEKAPERSGSDGSQMSKRIIAAYENGLQ